MPSTQHLVGVQQWLRTDMLNHTMPQRGLGQGKNLESFCEQSDVLATGFTICSTLILLSHYIGFVNWSNKSIPLYLLRRQPSSYTVYYFKPLYPTTLQLQMRQQEIFCKSLSQHLHQLKMVSSILFPHEDNIEVTY